MTEHYSVHYMVSREKRSGGGQKKDKWTQDVGKKEGESFRGQGNGTQPTTPPSPSEKKKAEEDNPIEWQRKSRPGGGVRKRGA